MLRVDKIEQELNNIGISVKENDGKYRPYMHVIDDIVERWNELNYNQQRDLADALLD